MNLKHNQLPQHLKGNLLPIYLVHGDESLIIQESTDQIRQAARSQGYSERIVFDVDNKFNWTEFSTEAQALSLFSDRKIIELRLTGKPSDKGKSIEEFCNTADGDTIVIISSPRLDKTAQKQGWFKQIDKIGVTSIIWPFKPKEVEEWASRFCRSLGKTIDYQALQLLLEKTEGNLLATKQEVEKLSLAIDESEISLDQLTRSIADNARYSVFDLTDACLKGDLAGASSVFNHLKAEGTELLALSGLIAKDIRTLNILVAASKTMTMDQAFQKAKVWKNKQSLYQSALRRHSAPSLANLMKALSTLDLSVKGMANEVPWHLFYEICMALAGGQQNKMRKIT
jgi:DNA polymerase-3 subunit delta